MRRICGFQCNAYVFVVQLLQAMQCHITESAYVCVDGNYPELLGAAPQASRAPRRRSGARTTCMVVRSGHTYLHNTFNTY